MKPFVEVCFRIGGYMGEDGYAAGEGVNPDICSDILEVKPDKQWKKGDLFGMKCGKV